MIPSEDFADVTLAIKDDDYDDHGDHEIGWWWMKINEIVNNWMNMGCGGQKWVKVYEMDENG